jgi:DNA-binding response OmpR family regulator
MPYMNGFELCEKIFAIDINVRVCFMSSGEINREALREIYPTRQEGCFIRKPVSIDYLLKRIRSELPTEHEIDHLGDFRFDVLQQTTVFDFRFYIVCV